MFVERKDDIIMEKFKLVKPTKEYEEKAIDYINEFYKYNSNINGVGGLHKYLNNYYSWLLKLDDDRICVPTEERVPSETFFLVREDGDKIVGMINIRLALNEKLRRVGGNIGYSIRPTERRKGYNKINLYLGLLECQKHDIYKVLIDCEKDNIGSDKTIQALGGVLINIHEEDGYDSLIKNYMINTNKSIKEYRDLYGQDSKNIFK